MLAVLSVVIAVGGTPTAAAASPSGKKITRTVRRLTEKYPVRSTLFGVWKNGRGLASSALGESRPGVPATRADHFRIGNITESLTVTLLLKLVDDGRLSLADPLSNWFPNLPGAQQVTLGMLARSISGYADFVTSPDFDDAFNANPFRRWKVPELLSLAFARPPLFAPGTSWAFSDTNFLLLARVLRRATGRPVDRLLHRRIWSELGMNETQMRVGPHIPAPVMHGYSSERGRYEDTTRWSPSWARGFGNVTSTLGDMGRWAEALGTGSLLSRRSHALQVGPQNVGLDGLTAEQYYGMGLIVSNRWIGANPQLLGYSGAIGYLPAKRYAVVVFATQGPRGNASTAYASAIFNRIGRLLAPRHPPSLFVCPRPPC